MSLLEAYISDSIDEAMEPYTSSQEYLESKKAVNDRITAFRNSLPDQQKEEFNQLLNMIDNANGEFCAKAYTYGAVRGIELRQEVLGR